MIKITDKPIQIDEAVKAATALGSGAINVFVGTVRNESKGKSVRWLEYEAFETMAISEMKQIIKTASEKWKILGFAVTHRVGTLHPGETAVVIAVSTPHRKESFEACEYIIDTLKERVPIFKKEVFENGEEWVSATP